MRLFSSLLFPLGPLAVTLCLPVTAAGQGPPESDIFLTSLSVEPERVEIGEFLRVTHREGYDNQPSFTLDGGKILFTSALPDGQTDIHSYNLISRDTEQLTATPESEYSATMTPDGSGFSVIRVEADGTQRLWSFDMEGGNPRLLLPEVKPVGYHAWLENGTLALFLLGDPPVLSIVPPGADRGYQAAAEIGRSVHAVPGEPTFSFTAPVEGEVWIQAVDPITRAVRPLAPALEGSQDYAWAGSSVILMARGSTLYWWSVARSGSQGWTPVEGPDLEAAGTITRLSVSPDGQWLAFVGSGPS